MALSASLRALSTIDKGMLRFVLDQSSDCIKILSPRGRVEYVNSEGQCALEISNFNEVCDKYWPDLWTESSRAIIVDALEHAQNGQACDFQASRHDRAGQERWWHVSVSPLLESQGDLAGIFTISRDITLFVQAREAEKTLALEMRHRLRNAYTIASAIVMQSSRDEATRPFAEIVSSRLADVALSQTRLLEAGQKCWAMAELVSTLVDAHGEGAQAIRFTGTADVAIDGHEAMLVALVLGELTNNSVKYGALRQHQTVRMSWLSQHDGLALTWCEPVPAGKLQSLNARDEGSGYSLMQRMARSQNAKFSWSVDDGELNVSLILKPR